MSLITEAGRVSGRGGRIRLSLSFLWAQVPSPNMQHVIIEGAGSQHTGQRLGVFSGEREAIWS